ACGGIQGDALVSVDGKPIKKTTFKHWMGVAAAATSTSAEGASAKPVIPEPPNYTACIAHLEATTPKPAKGQPPPTRAQLKSQAEVTKYYNEHKQRFEVPEKRAVNIILTKNEAAAKKAKAEVASGKSFASVAKSVSIDPVTKPKGGLLPEVTKGQQEQALSAA